MMTDAIPARSTYTNTAKTAGQMYKIGYPHPECLTSPTAPEEGLSPEQLLKEYSH